jgi:Ca2+-binding RTX toxin-like protein
MGWNWVHGTDSSETINGADGVTEGNDAIYGYGGNDTIYGLGGDDIIVDGYGADYMDGGAGIDTVDYTVSIGAVTVSLLTGTGTGSDAEGDTLVNIENLYGSNYDDILVGDGGSNSLDGWFGNDLLKGGGGTDRLQGGAGHDILKGGGGADRLDGNIGTDTAAYNESDEGVFVSLMSGTGTGGDAQGDILTSIENLTGSEHDDMLWGDDNANVLMGLGDDDSLKGYGGADRLWGGDGHDTLNGMDGNDTLRGEAGNDILNGGAGADTMIGGYGNDTYGVDNWWDVVTESGGQGTDVVRTSVSYALTSGSDIEVLETTNHNGTTALTLVGNSSGNQIIGNNGDNVISGGAGADEMVGRGGNDTYYVDNASDEITENGGQGIDTVLTSVSYTLTAGADVELVATTNDNGTVAINLTGNANGNIVQGNNGNNIINGGDGDDELTGLGGQDSFLFNTALSEDFNVDVITDFNVADDRILLDDAIFSSSLGLGNISSGEFVVGTAALDANDRIIYDSNSGALYYDSDGIGGTAAIQFAEVNPGLGLTHLDFFVV